MTAYLKISVPLVLSLFSVRILDAQQATIKVTGIVSFGIDGNPDSNPPGAGNVFGGDSDLTGKTFTLTINVSSSEGTIASGSCSDGALYTSTISGTNTTSAPTATLQIGNGSFTYGSYPLSAIGWTTGRTARESCSSFNSINFGWSENYTGGYTGTSGFGAEVIYSAVNFASANVFTTIPPVLLAQILEDSGFHFAIGLVQPGTLKNVKYAYGELLPQSFSVEGGQPLTIGKTLGLCICFGPPAGNTPASTPGISGSLPLFEPLSPKGTSNQSSIFATSHPGVVAVGDPITVATGNVFEHEMDYTTAGQNPLQFIRSYNSMTAPTTTVAHTMGVGWRSNYDRFIIPASTTVAVERPDGQSLTFTQNGGTWASDTDVDINLVQSGSGWTLTDSNDTIETYTSATSNVGGLAIVYGQLATIQLRNGYTQTLTYDNNNNLVTVTDSYSRSLGFTYSGGLLSSLATPDGLMLTYGYFGGVLTSVGYSTTPATSRSYLYENASFPYALTGIIDEDGNRFATWSYDSQGRALSAQHGSGADLTSIAYDDATGNRTLTHALGQQETYKFSTLQGVPKLVEIDRLPSATTAAATRILTYDTNGYISSQTDWNGNLTTFVNDVHGQPTTIVEASATPQARTTTIAYHPNFHLPVNIITPGLTTALTYDASGELLTKTLTDTTVTIAPYSTGGTSRVWANTWNDFLLASTKGPRTDIAELTTFTYDGSGALTAVKNALGQTISITSHTGGGLPITVVDPNGVTITFSYNARQWLLSSTLATTTGPLTTSLSYDAAGNLITTTLPDGSALTNVYDAAHRLTGVSDLFGNTIAYTLDANGDRLQANISDSSSAVQRKHSGAFDALGRMTQDIGGVGQTTGYSLDGNGNALSVTDPLARVMQQAFDPLNRLIRVIDAAGGITKLVYDQHDRPVTVVDANSGSTTYVYNSFGDIIQQISPDTGRTVYTYDPDGNLTQKTDARGAIANYTYDALNRLLTRTFPADAAENIVFTYDQSGYGFGVGRLTSLTDAVGSFSRNYDERGNILNETRTHGATTLFTSTTYDKVNRVSSITYPSGWKVDYSRDVMGRIASSTLTSPLGVTQKLLTGITYQPFGPVIAFTFGNGVAESNSFDMDYRLITLKDTGATSLQNLAYAYDAANNVSSITDGVTADNSQTLGYDVLDHLTTATGGYGNLAYSYSPIGNRLTQTVNGVLSSYTYAPHSNQLTKITSGAATQTLSYTAAGNIKATTPNVGAATSYTYNQWNRLASVTTPIQFAQYAYDAFGHRLVKTLPGMPDGLYQYDQAGNLLEEISSGVSTDYVYLDSRPIATIQPSSGKMYFLHDDRLGTPQMATDSGQAVQWATSYQPFGQTSPVGTIIQNLRFPGQELDAADGLYHNGFRDYVPGLGRYLESDPIGLGGGASTYQYVSGNPLAHIDRQGTDFFGTPTNGGPSTLAPITPPSVANPYTLPPPPPLTPAQLKYVDNCVFQCYMDELIPLIPRETGIGYLQKFFIVAAKATEETALLCEGAATGLTLAEIDHAVIECSMHQRTTCEAQARTSK